MKHFLDIKREKYCCMQQKLLFGTILMVSKRRRNQKVYFPQKKSLLTTFNRLQIVVILCRINLMLQMVMHISIFKTNWS